VLVGEGVPPDAVRHRGRRRRRGGRGLIFGVSHLEGGGRRRKGRKKEEGRRRRGGGMNAKTRKV
jgi:hypothetical protein